MKFVIQITSCMLLFQLQATDRDSELYGAIRYNIGSGDPQNQFDVNPESGLIYIIAPLDRESVS